MKLRIDSLQAGDLVSTAGRYELYQIISINKSKHTATVNFFGADRDARISKEGIKVINLKDDYFDVYPNPGAFK